MATTTKTTKKNTKKRPKRYMKKAARRTIAALLMVTALIVAAIPATPGAAAGHSYPATSYKWMFDDASQNLTFYFDGTDTTDMTLVYIEALSAESTTPTDIIIPNPVSTNYICKTIGTSAIKNSADIMSTVKSFTADSVETVQTDAFRGCPVLEYYTGGATKNVMGNAFMGCEKLINCNLSSSGVDTIGSHAFDGCTDLSSMPNSQYITTIGTYAFANTGLQGGITVPGPASSSGASALADHAFYNCSGITSMEFSGVFNSVGDYAFANCPNLRTLKLPDGLSTLPANIVKNESGESLLQEITIPKDVSSLPSGLFSDCNNLVCIHLNNKSDEGAADITIIDGSLPTAKSDDFYIEGYKNYTTGGITNPSKAYEYCMDNNIRYKWLDGEKGIADKYFDITEDGKLVNCRIDKYLDYMHTTSIDLSRYSDINTVGSKAFSYDSTGAGKVTEVDIGSNISLIEDDALSYFNNMDKVVFDEGVSTTIDDTAGDGGVFPSKAGFYIYGDMKKDDLDTLNQFEYAAKYNIEYRTGTQLNSSNKITLYSAGNYALTGAVSDDGTKITNKISEGTGIEDILVPSGIETIDIDLFKEDSKLKNIVMDGIKTVADNQFQSCVSLESVEMNGNALESMGVLPFRSCENLHSMTINSDLFSCDENGVIIGPDNSGDPADSCIIEALENYQTETAAGYTYNLPTSVTSIRKAAFEDNRHIEYFNSDNGENYSTTIEEIPEACFNKCKMLKGVTFGKGLTLVAPNAFTNQSEREITTTVYQPTVDYKDNSYNDRTGNTKYYFYSTSKEDSTYYWCNPKGKENDDNLIWKGLYSEKDPKKLSNCKIKYIKGDPNMDTPTVLKYTGSSLTWTATGTAMNGDFFVVDGSTTLEPGQHYVLEEIGEIKEKGRYSFVLSGIGDYSDKLSGVFYVKDNGTDEEGDLSGYKIVFPKGTTLPYTGSQYTIKSLDEKKSASDSNYGEFYVINTKAPYDVLKESERYTFSVSPSPVKERGSYKITVTSNADGKISADFVVSGDDPGPTPGLYKLSRIEYPSDKDRGGQTRYYQDGRKYNLVAGYDFIVYGTDEKVVDPSEYYVYCDDFQTDAKKTTIKDVVGDPLKTVEVPFTVETTPSSNYAASSVAGKFFIKPKSDNDGDFTIRLPIIDDIGFAEWTGSVIEPEPVVYSKTDSSTVLEIIKHYTLGYPDVDAETGPNNKDMGTNKGVVYVYGTGIYDGKTGLRYFNIRKSIPKYVSSTDKTNKITFTVTNGRYYTGKGDIKIEKDVDDGTEKKEEGEYARGTVSADVELTDATTGKKLVEGVDYTLSFKKESGMNGTVTVTGMGNYFGTFTSSKFPLKKNTSSSSSGTGGGGNNSSSSSSSSSSKSSSSSSSSSGGSSSSSSGSGSSSGTSGSGNRNSGTTVVNRNYYNSGNGGTVDELDGMLRAAHIDSINGGSADGYQVNITKSDAADAAFREALLRRYGSLDNIRYFSMDISLKDQNGNDIDTTGMSVTLTLPLPTSMEQYGTNNMIATVDGNGDLEDLNVQFSTLEGRPCATFVAPHFSPYGFYVNTSNLAVGTLDNTPKTGDPISPKWFLSFGLAALSIFLFLKKDPRPQAAKAA